MEAPVTVSIVVHRTPVKQLSHALECLLRSPAVSAVYVVDNSPTDTLRRHVEDMERVVYEHVENRGFGAGHNHAIRRALDAGARYHLVMNADVCWDGDVISPIVEYMDASPETGILMPRTLYPDGALQLTARRLPTPWDLIAKRFLPQSWTRSRMKHYLLADADHSLPIDSPYLLGSFLFLRTDAIRAEGMFDERFFMYPEDIDITRRFHRNWRTVLWPGVTIIHEHAAASRRSMRMLRIHMINMIRYFNKWGWFIDPERRRFNRRLDSLPKTANPPVQRG